MEKGELGRGFLAGEGGGDAMGLVAGRLAAEAAIKEAGFQGPGAAHAPEGCDHLFHHSELDGIEGAETGEVFGEEHFKSFPGLVFEHHDAPGEETVTESVLGRAPLSLFSLRPARAGAIGTGRKDTLFR